MTRDRSFAPEVMAMSLTPAMRALQKHDVTFTVTWKLDAVRRDGNQLLATIGSDYGGVTRERGSTRWSSTTAPGRSTTSTSSFAPARPTSARSTTRRWSRAARRRSTRNPEGRYQLFRIGDAVAARNTHAAIYDALRLVRTL